MSIRKISGNILADNLERGSNLSVQGNLVHFDVVNQRVGILTDTPVDDFEVAGVANAIDVRISSAAANSVLYADAAKLVKSSSNLEFDGSTLSVQDIDSTTAELGNIAFDNTTISSVTANSSITLSPNNSEVVIDTTSGLVLPVGNTAQRPGTPITGTVRYNSNLGIVEIYNGIEWEGVGEDVAAITQQTIVGDDSTVEFNLDQVTTATAVIVSTNGVVQNPGIAYTVSGNLITFSEAPLTTDVVDVRFISDISIVTAISDSSGNSSISVEESGVVNMSTVHSLQLPSYTVSQATALTNVSSGQVIYCSNGNSGSPCLAVYSVNAWRIVSLGGNITA